MFGLAVMLLQMVVLARLNFLGIAPDLILVSVIAFAVVSPKMPANLFSASLAFAQDLLSTGLYLNTVIKVIFNNAVLAVKDGYLGDEYALTAGLVALFSPLQLIASGAVYYFFLGHEFSLPAFIFRLFIFTLYNLMLVPLIFPLIRELSRDG
jgi:hypothetical protein